MRLPPSKPNPTLDALIAKARDHVMAADERRAQRISLMYGLQEFDSLTTKAEIADWLDRHEGRK